LHQPIDRAWSPDQALALAKLLTWQGPATSPTVVISIIRPIVLIVVAIIPVSLIVPTMPIFVPPPVVRLPAMFALFVQFVPRFSRFPALIAIVFNGLVQSVIGMRDPPLTVVVRVQFGNSGHYRESCYGQRR
jgi:hypothetical protein